MGLGRHVRGCFVLAMRRRAEEGPLRLLTGEHRCIAGNTTPEGPFEDSDLPPLLPSLSLPPDSTPGPWDQHVCTTFVSGKTKNVYSFFHLGFGCGNTELYCGLSRVRVNQNLLGRFPGTRILRSHCRGPHGAGVGVEPRICI